jgi:dTDP-4-amino-4,6-dideoxygalactose transaminase
MDPLVPAHYHDIVVDAGLVPIYVDVGDEGACIDPQKLELLVAESRKAEETDGSNGQAPDASSADTVSVGTLCADTISVGTLCADTISVIVTHTSLGYVPEMEVIAGFGVPVIEDISQGIGANTGDRLVGSYGRLTILGMEADGIITAGGGTLLLAASKADAARLRRIADDLPSDALLPDMNAALGLTQVKELERFISRRAELASVFARAVMRGRHTVPGQPGDGENIHFTFPVMVTAGTADVRQYARKKGVDTSMAFDGSVLAQQGRSADARNTDDPSVGSAAPVGAMISESDFPAARALGLRCVRFPLYPALTGKEAAIIERVLSTLP